MWFVFFFFFLTSFGFGFGFIVPFGGSTQAIPGQAKQGTPSLGGPQASGVTGFRKPCTGSPPALPPGATRSPCTTVIMCGLLGLIRATCHLQVSRLWGRWPL